MKRSILTLILFAFSTMLVAQNNPVDFEAGGIGADWTWTVFENSSNPPLEVIENPDKSGINTSDSVAQFIATTGGQSFAGAITQNIGAFKFDETNRTIKLMVWKTVISDVGIKFETSSQASPGEIKVANTKTNEWEELTFDFSGYANQAEDFTGLVIFPDFRDRSGDAENNTIYFDNLTFTDEMTTGGTIVEFCSETVYNNGNMAETSSAAILTIENTGAQTMKVSLKSADSDSLDALIVNNFDGPITGSPAVSAVDTAADGTLSLTLTWNDTPPTEVELNVLWSKDSFGGNWQLDSQNSTVSFMQMCGDGEPEPTDELLTNGDFELGDDGSWFGNALNIQTDGGNSFNFADVETAGDAFAVNLSQMVPIAQGETYTLKFDASSSGNGRSIVAGIGLNEAPFTAATEIVNLTSSTQTFTLELTASDFGSANSRVLFDMGADTGIVVLDNVSLKVNDTPPPVEIVEFCSETVYNNGNMAETASAAILTIKNSGAQSMEVSLKSADSDTLDALIVNNFDGPITGSPAVSAVDTAADGTLSLTLTWNDAPPAEVELNVLWSKDSFGGNWQLDSKNTTVSFMQMCGDTGGPEPGEELLLNGDFEAEAADPWFVNFGDGTVPIQEDGGNKFFIADVETAGDAFAVNLSQQVAIMEGETYTLKFDAASSGNGRTMVAGIGLNEAPFTNINETVNLTSSIETFSFDFTAGFGNTNSRVLFDMGADTGVVVIDNVSLVISDGTGGDDSMPEAPAPTPTEDAENVISLFSSAYTDVSVDTWRTEWSSALFTDSVDIAGTPVKKYSALDFVGIETVTNQVDASNMTNFRVDVWSSNFTSFSVKLVDFGADGAFGGGDDSEHQVDFENPTQNEWVTFDIPFEDFTGLTARANIAQYIFVTKPTGGATIFVDNMFFYDNMGVSIDDNGELPSEFALGQNYPNPFNPTTNISYNLPESGEVTLEVFNIQGQRVATLVSGFKTAGSHTLSFDASHLASGVYTYRLISKNSIKVKKMMLIK